MSEQIIVAIIEALGMILAAIITIIGMLLAATKISQNKKLRMDLITAYRDIQVLYTIERFHNEINIVVKGLNNKIPVRKMVKEQEQLILSGKNTRSCNKVA